MVRTQGLKDAIENLYGVFSAYSLLKNTDPCPCCHTADDEQKLFARPLRELDTHNLEKYIQDALFVWGSVNTFKHFLPRIFELLFLSQEQGLVFADPETVFNKLQISHWRSWPNKEQIAVERLLIALWDSILTDPPENGEFNDVESWLCTIAQCEEDLAPYLNYWLKDDRETATLALIFLIANFEFKKGEMENRNAYWEKHVKQYFQLQEWIESPAVQLKLKTAIQE